VEESMKKPIISFCIPTYNRAKRVLKCVTHILQYRGDEIEIVVSSNASNDNTLELLEEITDKRLKVYSNQENILELNWPLVVSKATGKFAALMSDEDYVCIENLPYFFELLNEADEQNIGAIIYNFPEAMHIGKDYKSQSAYESLKIACTMGGHITSHILNMRFFVLKEDSGYEQFSLQNPHEEPQQEILTDIAMNHPVWLIKKSLCKWGKEDTHPDKLTQGLLKTVIEENFLGAPFKQKLLFMSRTNKALDINGSDDDKMYALLHWLISLPMFCISMYLVYIVRGAQGSRDAFVWEEAKKHFGYDQKDVTDILIKQFNDFTNYHNEKYYKPCWKLFQQVFADALNQKYDKGIPEELSFYERIALGDTIFMVHQIYNAPYSFTSEGKRIFYNYPDDYNDALEGKTTGFMYYDLLRKKKDYDGVINFKGVSTFRAEYVRGLAFFLKSDYESAKACFEKFLDTVLNPKCVGDIITGARAVQYSYYFLGLINQELDDLAKAVYYFAKCYELTDKLILGANLFDKAIKGLGID